MKIRLSEDEVYEIKMPEEIEIQEFQGIVSKFNFLLKNFIKFDIGGETTSEQGEIILNKNQTKQQIHKTHDKTKWLFLRDNRNAVVEILKTHYLGTIEEFESVVNTYGLKLGKADMCSTMFKVIKEMHKVEPKEVGLKAFPTKEIQVKHLKLNQGETENEQSDTETTN